MTTTFPAAPNSISFDDFRTIFNVPVNNPIQLGDFYANSTYTGTMANIPSSGNPISLEDFRGKSRIPPPPPPPIYFMTPGTWSWTVPTGVSQVQVLVVGGGGGGGGTNNRTGGGGGGGQVRSSSYSVIAGNNYTIEVGDGGLRGDPGTNFGRGGNWWQFKF